MMLSTLHAALTDERQSFRWLDLVLILLVGIVIFAAGIGLRDPWPADEPRFAVIARDMIQSGAWFFPKIGGVYYPDKPPVFFWTIASFYKLTGSLRIAFLLPSLLASLGVLILIYDLGRRLWNRGTGMSAAFLLLFTLQFTNSAKVAQIDMLLCLWITLAIYGFCRHLLQGPAWGWYFLGFAAAGLGVITKGVGFLALFIFVPYLAMLVMGFNQQHRMTWNWHWIAGPVIFLMVIALWLAPMLISVENSADPALAAYRDNILFRQTGDRYLRAWDHQEPFWYYLSKVIPVMWLPLSLLLPWLIPAWFKSIRSGDPRVGLLLGWLVCVILFFSLASGKRGVYLLSVLPITALLAAPYIHALFQKIAVQRLLFIGLFSLGAMSLSLTLYFTQIDPAKGAELVNTHQINPWKPLLLIGVIGLIISLLARPRYSPLGWMGFLSAFWLVYSLWVYPRITDIRSGATFIHAISSQLKPGQEIAMVGWKEQFLLYIDRPVTHFGFRRHHEKRIELPNTPGVWRESLEAVNWLGQNNNRRLLIANTRLSSCFTKNPTKLAGYTNQKAWYLLSYQDVNKACVIEMPAVKGLTYDPKLGRLIN